ncbi:MAG: hypothetical protein KC931_21195, partial [Candidatus Omnitrophica bacterium]|nr:hypothetical protein [Candidatus Omnitrophota bacterium]
TFRMLGVTGKAADKGQQRWVYRTVGLLILTVIVLAIPLERKLEAEIRRGKSQPSTFPLTVAVMDELNSFIDTSPGVELVAAGRSSQNAQRVNIVLSSPEPLPYSYANDVADLVRKALRDDGTTVNVHCLREGWLDYSYMFDVSEELFRTLEDAPEVRLVAAGRSSLASNDTDLTLVLTMPEPLPEELKSRILKIVGEGVDDRRVSVDILAIDPFEAEDVRRESLETSIQSYFGDSVRVDVIACGELFSSRDGIDAVLVLSSQIGIPSNTLRDVNSFVQENLGLDLRVKTISLIDPWRPLVEENIEDEPLE